MGFGEFGGEWLPPKTSKNIKDHQKNFDEFWWGLMGLAENDYQQRRQKTAKKYFDEAWWGLMGLAENDYQQRRQTTSKTTKNILMKFD